MTRPECFDFAMDFLGGPQDVEVVAYVESLERENERLRGLLRDINSRPRHLNAGAWEIRLYQDDYDRIDAALAGAAVQPSSPADGQPVAEGVARAEVVPYPYGEGRTDQPSVAVPADRLSDFWRGIYPDGITVEKVCDELHDLEFLAEEVPKVYDHVSGGRISKPNTYAFEVMGEHDRCRERDIEEALAEAKEDEVTPSQQSVGV